MRRSNQSTMNEKSFDDTDFLVVDVETTGLSTEAGDRICELGMVKLRSGEIVDSYGTLINPERSISAGAFAVNKISSEMLQDAPTFRSIVPQVRGKIDDSILVAYNAPFDLSFLRSEFLKAGLTPPRNRVVDALGLARQLLPGLYKYSQENVAAITGISHTVAHRALDDAKITATLFQMFLTILRTHGCSSINDLWRNDLRTLLQARRLQLIQHALQVKCNLWIKYLSPSDNRITDNIITPLTCMNDALPPSGERNSIVGIRHASGERTTFRLMNILDLRFIHPFSG